MSLHTHLRTQLKTLLDSVLAPLRQQTPDDPRAMATAMLLMEVAWADQHIAESEIEHMRTALQRLYALDANAAATLVEQARAAHASMTSMQPFTHALNQHLGADERIEVLRELWRLAASDDAVDRFEEHLMRRIADLLYINHADYIAAKLAATRRE